ncbi:MAG: CRISPR-associated endonuclease Cas1 [Planctomycetaceae bacterium]|nr:CRISPR-associated endonuclease Cas1 [Planctomycetaceae bacterium]
MLNEFVYCPRLFYYEWVEGVFADSVDTVAGSLRHQKLERKEDALPAAEELVETQDKIHSRSVQLASDTHRLIAKLDLIEGEGDLVVPVDYKIGKPRKDSDKGELSAWDTDRVQLAAQGLILRENGYRCEEGVIYYVATKQRVRVPLDDELVNFTLDALRQAREAAFGPIPPPLVDSPKCARCSLVGICLPDETRVCIEIGDQQAQRQLTLFDGGEPTRNVLPKRDLSTIEVRRLVPARDDLKPLYLNSQGFRVGKSGEVLQVHDRDKKVQEIRMNDVSQINIFGNIQISTQAIQSLCSAEIPVSYFSMGGWFYGVTQGIGIKNIFLRREQFRHADRESFCLPLCRQLVSGKIRNQRTMLLRNHVEPPRQTLALLKEFQDDSERADSLPQLLGIEGNAARLYFENFNGMLKVEAPDDELTPEHSVVNDTTQRASPFRFDFTNRNRRPPRDPVNALLSLAYSMLSKDLSIVCHAVGFDPYLGFYHQPRFGRPALALDLMEPFRPLIADSAVLSAINTRMITSRDFIRTGPAVALTPDGRKAFYRAYEQRMDTLVTHPLFGYRVTYRRVLEIQTRLLARRITGEIRDYPPFITR